jgi:hypothetical protein
MSTLALTNAYFAQIGKGNNFTLPLSLSLSLSLQLTYMIVLLGCAHTAGTGKKGLKMPKEQSEAVNMRRYNDQKT